MFEIERKFLPNVDVPVINYIRKMNPVKEIKQGYLYFDNMKEETRIRSVRQNNDTTFFMTIKKGKGLKRVENELEISSEEFYNLSKNVNKWIVKKRYIFNYAYPNGNLIECSLDEFLNQELQDLLIVEVEFPDKKTAKDFKSPEWFGEDITNDHKYYNSNLVTKIKENEK